jgi:K+-sensing histidine kinase KdpD
LTTACRCRPLTLRARPFGATQTGERDDRPTCARNRRPFWPQAEKEGRGRLKIFLGAAPGVGKTYAMLEDAAPRRAAEGVDVVAAVVETHGRAETEAMLADLEVLPKRPQFHRDRFLHEMDLDGLLARQPRSR